MLRGPFGAAASLESAARVSERSGILRLRDIAGGLARRVHKQTPYVVKRILWRRDAPCEPSKHAVERLVRRGDVAADIGAQFGLVTARFRSLVGRRGHVHAFEPFPRTGPLCGRWRGWRAGRSSSTRRALRHERRGGPPPAAARRPGAPGRGNPEADHGDRWTTAQEIEAPTRRLEDVLGDTARLDFVKCDVESDEDRVVAGGREVMAEHAPNVHVELDYRHPRTRLRGDDQLAREPRPRGLRPLSGGPAAGLAVRPRARSAPVDRARACPGHPSERLHLRLRVRPPGALFGRPDGVATACAVGGAGVYGRGYRAVMPTLEHCRRRRD
jgi:FkbM family methyltransferase